MLPHGLPIGHDGSATGPDSLLLGDSDFQRLLAAFMRRVVTWDEFLEMNVPAGISPVKTWELISAVTKSVGIVVPVNNPDDGTFWYQRTYQLTDAVRDIVVACQSGSRLHRAITASGGQHFLMKMRLDETVAAARLDGLDIASEVLPHLAKGRPPHNASERLITNATSIAKNIGHFAERPFSPDMFRELRDALLLGVGEGNLPTTSARLGLLTYPSPPEGSEEFSETQLERIAAYANHEAGDPYDHPVLRAYVLALALRPYRPLGQVSSMVGRLAAQIYCIKHNLPVLALLPISRLKIEWEDGRFGPEDVACDRDGYRSLCRRSPDDLTVLQTITVQLIGIAIREMISYIEEWQRRDNKMRELLRKDPELNQRQRSIVSRALRSPESEFTIRYHEANHAIAYTTARRDFLELAAKGYLRMHQRGKVFIFSAAPCLTHLIESDTPGG